MSHRTPPPRQPGQDWDEEEEDDSESIRTTSVINAHSLFRLLLVLLTIWTVFEGIALATGAFSAVDAGADRTAERMLGGLMIVLGGVYAMLAWRRGQYRLMLWVPFAAQIAIVAPLLFSFDRDRILLLVISSGFLALMLYVWWQSRDIEDPYDGGDEEEYDAEDDLTQYADGVDEEPLKGRGAAGRRSSPATSQERASRFRRRDG